MADQSLNGAQEDRKPYTKETWPGYKWIRRKTNDGLLGPFELGGPCTEGVYEKEVKILWRFREITSDGCEASHDGKTWFPCYEGGERGIADVPASVLDAARDAWRLFKRIDAAGLAMGYGAGFSVDGVDFHLTIRRMTFPRFVERSEDRTDAEIGKSLGGEEAGVEAKSSVESIPLSSQLGDLIVRRDTNGDFLLILDGRYVKPDVRWNQIGRIYEWMIDGELEWAETPEDHARDDAFIREMIARNPVNRDAEQPPPAGPDASNPSPQVTQSLRCPDCGGPGQWRRGVGFEHEKICMRKERHKNGRNVIWCP